MGKLGWAALAAAILAPVPALAQNNMMAMTSHHSHAGLGIALILILLVLAVVGLIVHFLPGIIATRRQHRNALAIWLVNIFFGWTVIGWVIALIWALN